MGLNNYSQYLFEAENVKDESTPDSPAVNAPTSDYVAKKGDKCARVPDKKMILSERFRKVLNDIQSMKQSNISRRLLELETSGKLFDISYLDCDSEGENVSYLQSGRIDRLKKEEKPFEEYWTTKMRIQQKIGRFIKQLSDGKAIPKFSDESIQTFAKKFKAVLKESAEEINFEVVEGDDIVYWYDCRNYENDNGTLGGSCMSGPEAGRYLSVYKNNPNQCKLLILKSSEGQKIKGRALVWKLSEPKDKIFMDRVYCNDDDDEIMFCNYAKKQGWLFKDEQKYGGTHIIVPGEGSKEVDLEVKLENTKFNLYPYVDTLRYFYPDLKMMASHNDEDSPYYTLTDTEGHYEEWRGEGEEDPMVYDAYNKQEIPESRATWCRYDNNYCATEDAIRLSYNNEYAFPDSPNVVYSEYTKKRYAKVDAEFSKLLNTWIWNKYIVDVYHDRSKRTPPDKTHRFELNKTIGKVGDDYYDIDILYPISSKQVPIKGKPGKFKTEVTYGFREDIPA
jgi:hypothetical protein